MSKQAHQHLIDTSMVRYSEVCKLVSANGVIFLQKSVKENLFDFLALHIWKGVDDGLL